jgi:branched-chain amino acid transport system ATP-binding protein
VTAVLRTEGLSVNYGGVHALVEVDLEVGEGQLVGLIGPNGAGKTTFIDAVTGIALARGRVILDGRELSGLPPDRRARGGLARTWQSAELFDELTVRENLAVTSGAPSVWQVAREIVMGRATESPAVEQALRLLELERFANTRPGEITQGQRKLVGVARALAAEPRLILLDEPAAGLDASESEILGRHLRQIVESGKSMLLVDHDMGLVLTVCDYVVVLDFGKVIARGKPEDVRKDQGVVEAYLGSAATEVIGEAVAEQIPSKSTRAT